MQDRIIDDLEKNWTESRRQKGHSLITADTITIYHLSTEELGDEAEDLLVANPNHQHFYDNDDDEPPPGSDDEAEGDEL